MFTTNSLSEDWIANIELIFINAKFFNNIFMFYGKLSKTSLPVQDYQSY